MSFGIVYIYAAPLNRHALVAERWNQDPEKIRGGGSIFVFENVLSLAGYSHEFGSIPNNVAERSGILIKPELERRGIDIQRVKPVMFSEYLNKYWEKIGLRYR